MGGAAHSNNSYIVQQRPQHSNNKAHINNSCNNGNCNCNGSSVGSQQDALIRRVRY